MIRWHTWHLSRKNVLGAPYTSLSIIYIFKGVAFFLLSSRSIKRVIFNSLVKPNVNEKGEKQMETISTSQALQISGRAGRSVSLSFTLPREKTRYWLSRTVSLSLNSSPLSPPAGSPPNLQREKSQPCTETICWSWRKYLATRWTP